MSRPVVVAVLAVAASCAVVGHTPDGDARLAAGEALCGAAGGPMVGLAAFGQSLAVGAVHEPPYGPEPTPSYGNAMLSCSSWPATAQGCSLVPLLEPMRPPAVKGWLYPGNLLPGSNPPSTIAASLIASHTGWRFGVTNVAINGAHMAAIERGTAPYEAALDEARAFTALAPGFYVAAVLLTHGESDNRLPDYRARVVKLRDDYAADVAAITGQTTPPVMIATQQSSLIGSYTGSAVQLLAASHDRPGGIIVAGPKYQMSYGLDDVHLRRAGYDDLGALYARVFEAVVVRGEAWGPLEPVEVTRPDATTVLVRFHVQTPPLSFDASIPAGPGKGLEVRDRFGQMPIVSVAIEGDAVRVALGRAATCPCLVAMGATSTKGQLRDGANNYAVHFTWDLP